MLQSTSPVSQIISSQKFLPSASVAGAAQQDLDSDFEQQTDSTFSVHPMEEEGEVCDQEAGIPEQELDQQRSEEQNYQKTVTGVPTSQPANYQ